MQNAALLLLAFLLASPLQAQIIMRRHARRGELPPKVLIILLPTGQGRLEAMRQMGRTDLATRLNSDLTSIRNKLIMDFNDNYNYGPYYFVADSNADKVERREFNGILLGPDLKVVSNPVIGAQDTAQMVAYYGYLERRDLPVKKSRFGVEYYEMFDGDSEVKLQGLVLCDYRLSQLNRPLPRQILGSGRNRPKQSSDVYWFNSKNFDLEYSTCAGGVSDKLRSFYGPYPYGNF